MSRQSCQTLFCIFSEHFQGDCKLDSKPAVVFAQRHWLLRGTSLRAGNASGFSLS